MTFGTPLRCSQNIPGAQMIAMNTARKKGTRRELDAFIPATTMMNPARIRIAGTLPLAGGFKLSSIGTSLILSCKVRAILRIRDHPYLVFDAPLKIQSPHVKS